MDYARGIEVLASLYGDKRDRLGKLALLHPLEVAEQLDPDDADGRIVALFHDALEDGFATDLDDIPGASDETRDAIWILTRDDRETYSDYIARVRDAGGVGGEIARRVKFADLAVNFARCIELEDGDGLRLRYARALRELAPT